LLDNPAYRKKHTAFELNYDYSVKPDNRESVLLVGNSHAEDLLKAMSFSYLAELYRLNLTSPEVRTRDINYEVSCLHAYLTRGSTRCKQEGFPEEEYGPNLVHQYKDADVIVLASRWEYSDLDIVPDLIGRITSDGKKVIVVSNTPESAVLGEKRLNRLDAFMFEQRRLPSDEELFELEKQFYDDYIMAKSDINNQLRDIVTSFDSPKVEYADRADFMCDRRDRRCFLFFKKSLAKTLWDYGHTTTEGARELARKINASRWLSEEL
jgi:hypothetical protein